MNQVGTLVANGDTQGNFVEGCLSGPFGDGQDCTPSYDYTETHFTDKLRDQESNNDYFGARYFGSTLGRFLSPDDPSADRDPSDPQSWNLYSYVRNNPLTNTDEDGHTCQTNSSDGNTYDDGDGQGCSVVGDEIAQYNAQHQASVTVYAQPSGAFEPGSLAAGLFGPAGAKYFTPASSVVQAAGGLAVNMMAPLAGSLAGCSFGGSGGSCAASMALSLLPEVAELKAGATLLREAAAAGKGAEILSKGGGAAQAAKEFEALPAVSEQVNGATKIKTLSDGSKAVLYDSTGGSGRTTISIQDAAGHTETKIRY